MNNDNNISDVKCSPTGTIFAVSGSLSDGPD